MIRILVTLALAVSLFGCSSGEESRREASAPSNTYAAQAAESAIIGNRNSGKFHLASCQWAQKMSYSNRVAYGSVDAARAAGMKACKVCRP